MNTLKNNKGFTLVESLVALALSAILGFVIYTVAFAYTNETSASISRFMMQQQYDNVAARISRDVRCASFVVAQGETPVSHGIGFDSVPLVRLFDWTGQAVTQYAIVNGLLYEGIPQKQYSAGGAPVQLADAGSFFIVTPQRKKLGIHLSICKTERSNTYTLSPRRAMFVCRN
ncbi:MAG: prepilin-type N-terminal cleavage/methylation domain-containing protein [Chitinispirillaceae bacterium]|nr:prepilin-type N-terminal cleavage/methylation domain-containing protein [Chitinispirillaceae bacterium]